MTLLTVKIDEHTLMYYTNTHIYFYFLPFKNVTRDPMVLNVTKHVDTADM